MAEGGNEISVAYEELFQEATMGLETAITGFEPFLAEFSSMALEGNSDFMNCYNWLLENMADDISPQTLQDIKDYKDKVVAVAVAFYNADSTQFASAGAGQ
jgi:hypothetical protein